MKPWAWTIRCYPFLSQKWKAYEVSNGALSFVLVPEWGGRIVSLKFEDFEFFCLNKAGFHQSFAESFSPLDRLPVNKRQNLTVSMQQRILGGAYIEPRLVAKPPDPLRSPIGGTWGLSRYSLFVKGKSIYMKSLLDEATGLQVLREFCFEGRDSLSIKETCYNYASKALQVHLGLVFYWTAPMSFYLAVPREHFIEENFPSTTEELKNTLTFPSPGFSYIDIRAKSCFSYALKSLRLAEPIRCLKSTGKKDKFIEMTFAYDKKALTTESAPVVSSPAPASNTQQSVLRSKHHKVASGILRSLDAPDTPVESCLELFGQSLGPKKSISHKYTWSFRTLASKYLNYISN